MKILLSGGWGYGNLGDDALMRASISLIQKKFPDCTITLLTSDIDEAKRIIPNHTNIEFTHGMHHLMYGFDLPHFFPRESESFLGKLFNVQKIKIKIARRRIFKKGEKEAVRFGKRDLSSFPEYREKFDYFRNLCKNHDLYIMSGGGYLNRWHHMMISKYVETMIASNSGLPLYIIGQTLGPFTKATRCLAEKIVKLSNVALFRDDTSIREFPQYANVCQKSIPDLALVEEHSFAKKNRIVVIPFTGMMKKNKKRFIEELSKISADEIVFSVSQLWAGAISEACYLYWFAKSMGLNAVLRYSKDVNDLQTIVGEASLVVSENLHGLILAYRAHTDIVCMNNKRKFLTFMDMIGFSDRIVLAEKMTTDVFLNFMKCRMSFEMHQH
ncbi:MAG: polysaccharide pyruvyl transferase family protein, partial [Fibrobacteraceae bacterium]|nr:polysaccharide pyruvyl transferase family protein [Fibrobacteraceae bacterium]